MSCPIVLYLAAHYNNPGGVEVYLLHYATEMRRRGFDTRIAVFQPLPETPHWCLEELGKRGIPIAALGMGSGTDGGGEKRSAHRGTESTEGGWWREVDGGQRTEDRGQRVDLRPQTIDHRPEEGRDLRATVPQSNVQGLWSKVSSEALRVRGMLRGRWSGPTDAEMERWQSKRRQIRNLKRMLRTERPDIIHVKGRIIAEAWSVLPPERTVFHVATAGQRDASWDTAEVEVFRCFIERCARVFAPGAGVAERFKREFGIQREVISIFTMAPDEGEGHWSMVNGQWSLVIGHWPLGVETGDRGPQTTDKGLQTPNPASRISHPESPNGNLRFGFLGRLHEEKGLHELLDALRLLWRDGVDVPFLFAGEGPMGEDIGKVVNSEQWTNVRVERVEHPVQSLMEMDVVVLPSRSEAMPLALVEGMMCGRPCIATAVGGIPDLIRDGLEGFLIPPGDVTALADAMRRFCRMPIDELAAMSVRARRRYEECCRPESVGCRVAEIYRMVVASAAGRREGIRG